MQAVVHNINHIHPFFTELDKLYSVTSDTPHRTLINTVFNDSFKDVCELFKDYGGVEYDIKFKYKRYDKIDLPQMPTMNIIVCFSGGKDSLATALHYRKCGYKVYLYHCRGINQTYRDEYKSVETLADVLQMPLIMERVNLVGSHCWTEHPLKNWIIAGKALQWGIRNGITTKIAFGNYRTSRLIDDPFGVCGGDSMDMWRAFETAVKPILPKFKIYIALNNIQSAFTVINKHPQFLSHLQSCIGPYRYREYLHNNNEKKYGVKLLPHRCGSCWKCAVEYIWFTDHNKLKYDRDFYKHCIAVLRRTMKEEEGVTYKSERAVWERYLFYDIKKSKYFSKKQFTFEK